jgi:hypothetical protein
VIDELVVLLRVEDLEERRGRVAAEVAAHLVDLVEDDDGILRRRALHRVDDPAGEGADVRAPVSADLGLVLHAAEAHALEVPPERAGDAPPERGLADARRSEEAAGSVPCRSG